VPAIDMILLSATGVHHSLLHRCCRRAWENGTPRSGLQIGLNGDMTYDELHRFLLHDMRMSHVYQPVMLMTLLREGGSCPERTLAQNLLDHDMSQIEYYENIVRDMVGRVLRKRGFVERDKSARAWNLKGYESLTADQVEELIGLCQERLERFIEARGATAFDHRKRSLGVLSGTLKYEVLKRARFRCELCGVMDSEKALEVDHILPRNHGGLDDISNLQALCYSCNAMKRDRDSTDFRAIRDSYDHRNPGCLFCEIPNERIIDITALAYVVRDAYPVSELHTLVIPRRHVGSYFQLGQPEINACTKLLKEAQNAIVRDDGSVDGFNIGINDGAVAGQTIPHCHLHLIPRRAGDVPEPRGGVRHIIPGRGSY
jgi:ATP adenylyltransferase